MNIYLLARGVRGKVKPVTPSFLWVETGGSTCPQYFLLLWVVRKRMSLPNWR